MTQPPPERPPSNRTSDPFVYISHGIIHSGKKTHCEYCLSNSYDDASGNCMCCGAPRPKQDTPSIQFKYRSNPMISYSTSPEVYGDLWSTT